jgi:hypothetical protein
MNTKQALIKTTQKNFFKHWLVLTRPMHKLAQQDINVLALILYHYFEFKKQVGTSDLAWKLTFDYDTKIKMREDLGFKNEISLNNAFSTLRRAGAIKHNQVTPAFLPMLDLSKSNTFSLIYKFEIDG